MNCNKYARKKLIYQAKQVIYEGQTYSNSLAVAMKEMILNLVS